jgi:hypothetical protein
LKSSNNNSIAGERQQKTKNMKSKKKLFIFSIVSAATLLLILFCVLILLRNNNFDKKYAFDLSMPTVDFYEDACGCTLEKALSYRNYKSYELVSDKNQNQKLFTRIQSDVRDIVKRDDSKNGIHIKFNTKTKYGDVVRILDICHIEKAPTYILKDYDVWIMTGSNAELAKNCPFKPVRPSR